MITTINTGEGIFEIHYLHDFSRITRYRKDYELFVIRFYPGEDLPENRINDLFDTHSNSLFEAIDSIVASHYDFFSNFRIEKTLHGDFCMKEYNAQMRKNIISCYMKKLKFVSLNRQKHPKTAMLN